MSNFHLSSELAESISNLARLSYNNSTNISQMLLIQQQSEMLMEMSRGRMCRKYNNLSTQISQISIDTSENPLHEDISLSCLDVSKQRLMTTEDESGDSALDQVRKFCSKRTYYLIKSKFADREDNQQSKRLAQQIRHNQELMKKCIKLTQEVAEYKSKLENLSAKVEQNEKLKLKVSAAQKIALNKEESFVKWEKSMIYKEKMHSQIKRNLSYQFELLNTEKLRNQELKEAIETLLKRFSSNKISECTGSCWRKGLEEKCLENLQTQRKIIEAQQENSQRHCAKIEKIVENLKREVEFTFNKVSTK